MSVDHDRRELAQLVERSRPDAAKAGAHLLALRRQVDADEDELADIIADLLAARVISWGQFAQSFGVSKAAVMQRYGSTPRPAEVERFYRRTGFDRHPLMPGRLTVRERSIYAAPRGLPWKAVRRCLHNPAAEVLARYLAGQLDGWRFVASPGDFPNE